MRSACVSRNSHFSGPIYRHADSPHCVALLRKLHLRDRVQAAIHADEPGLVAPGSIH